MPEPAMQIDDQAAANIESRLHKLERRRLYDAIAGLLLSLAIVGHLLFGSCPGGGILARIAPNDKVETAATPKVNIPNATQENRKTTRFRIIAIVVTVPMESVSVDER